MGAQEPVRSTCADAGMLTSRRPSANGTIRAISRPIVSAGLLPERVAQPISFPNGTGNRPQPVCYSSPAETVGGSLVMKRYLVAPLTLLVIGAAAQTWAHHSFAATYLENQTVTIEGELVQFVLRNPHSCVEVDVTEKDGTKTRYVIEWAAPAQLAGKVDRDT